MSDPTLALSEDVTLAWYAGADGLPLQQTLPLVFRHIIERLEPSSVWFFGGSGGGFASLYYASKVPNSAALVWNPQTDILEYNPNHVLKYAQTAFGCGSYQEARAVLSERVETQLNPSCKVIYLQNSTDWHVKRHLEPLFERMGLPPRSDVFSGLVRDGFYLHMGAWGMGHAAPPKPALTFILRALLPATEDLFEDDGARIRAAMDGAFEQVD